MAKFKTACDQFARKVLLLLSVAFGIDDVNFFLNNCTHLDDPNVGNECDMRAIYYPPIPENHAIPEGTVRCASHTDYELMTFLFQDNVGGLEVCYESFLMDRGCFNDFDAKQFSKQKVLLR